MKRILILIVTCIAIFSCGKNEKKLESKREALYKDNTSIKRFSTTIKYLEDNDSNGNRIDSITCTDLLHIGKRLKNDSLIAISYNWIGFYFFQNKGDNSSALEYYFKALPIAEKYNDKRRISSLYFDIASVYHSLQNTDKFLYYTKKGEKNLPNEDSPMYNYMLIQYQRNMATISLEKSDFESALDFGTSALITSNKINIGDVFKFRATHFLGHIYAELNDNELADIYYKKALVQSDSIKDEIKKMSFFKRYFKFLITRNQVDKARIITEKMWLMSTESQNLNFKLLAAGSKKELFDNCKQIDSAYFYSKKEFNIREALFNENNMNTLNAFAFRDNLRKEEENEKKIEEAHLRDQNIQLFLISICIILFITLIFLLSRTIIFTEKWIIFFGTLGLLIVFEFINILIHPFVAKITHHSPLLMLLSFVPLAALLIPLHHHIEKWIIAKMTEKNKKIRLDNAKKTVSKLEVN